MDRPEPPHTVKLLIFVLIAILFLYGLVLMIVPQLFLLLAQPAEPVSPYFLRWPGALLTGAAIAGLGVLRRAARATLYFDVLKYGALLTAVVMLYSLIDGEYSGALWFGAFNIAVAAIVFAIGWWAKQKVAGNPLPVYVVGDATLPDN